MGTERTAQRNIDTSLLLRPQHVVSEMRLRTVVGNKKSGERNTDTPLRHYLNCEEWGAVASYHSGRIPNSLHQGESKLDLRSVHCGQPYTTIRLCFWFLLASLLVTRPRLLWPHRQIKEPVGRDKANKKTY